MDLRNGLARAGRAAALLSATLGGCGGDGPNPVTPHPAVPHPVPAPESSSPSSPPSAPRAEETASAETAQAEAGSAGPSAPPTGPVASAQSPSTVPSSSGSSPAVADRSEAAGPESASGTVSSLAAPPPPPAASPSSNPTILDRSEAAGEESASSEEEEEEEPEGSNAGAEPSSAGGTPSAGNDPRNDVIILYSISSFTATAKTFSSIEVRWSIRQEVDIIASTPSLTLRRRKGTTGAWVTLSASGLSGSKLDTGLEAETTYNYSLEVVGPESSDSASASATTPEEPPEPCTEVPNAPSSVNATATSSSAISVSWNHTSKSNCNPSYKIERKTTSGSFSTIVSSQKAKSYSDTGLSANTTYTYRVTATNDAGSTAGSPASATTPCLKPSGLSVSATSLGTSSIRVTWTINSFASGCGPTYKLERKTTGSYRTIDSDASSPHTDRGLTADTTYTYKVTATNNGGSDSDTAFDATDDLPSPPPSVSRPSGLSATVESWSKIDLEWNAVSGADSYEVRRSLNNSTWGSAVNAGSDTEYADSGLSGNTTYYYQVRTVDGSRRSSWTSSVNATTEVRPPPNLEASVESTTSIEVRWDAVAGADGYELRRSTDDETWGAAVDVGASTDHLDSGLSTSTTYYYQVRTVDGTKESDWTDSVSAMTGLGVSAAAESWDSIEVSWDAVSGVDSYDIRRSTDDRTWGTAVDAGSDTSYTDTGLSGNTTYYYQVRTVTGTTESAWSAAASATTEVEVPGKLAAAAASSTSIELRWDAVLGADRYELRRSTDDRNWGSEQDVGAVTEHVDTGLTTDTRYYYQVRTVDGTRRSDWSDSVDAAPGVLAPDNLAAQATSSSSIELSWDLVTGADGYEVRSSPDDSTWGTEVDAGSGTSFVDAGLDPETEYYYQVRTVDGSNRSDWTASVSATTESAAAPDPPDPPAAPEPPANFESTGATATTVTLRWDAVSAATHYRIRRRQEGVSGWSRFAAHGTGITDEEREPETTYHYQIRAEVSEGPNSAWSTPELSVTTAALGTPENFRTTAQTATTVSLAWDEVTDAEGYELRRDESSHLIDVGEHTTHVDKGLTMDTTYEYEVRAYLGTATSAWSASVSAITGAGLTAPDNLAAAATSSFSVGVTWDAVSSADGYEVYRIHSESYVRVTETSYEETGLMPETTYSYQVRSLMGNGQSPWPLAVSATTPAFAAPASFAAIASGTTVALSWDAVPGADISYRIRRRSGTESWESFDTAGTSLSDEDLEEETEYEYQIRAVHGTVESPWSDSVTAATGALPLMPPENFEVEEIGGAHVELSWDAFSSADGYDVERLGGTSLSWTAVAEDVTETEYLDGGLRPDTSYRYRVRTVRGAEDSEWSAELDAQTSEKVDAPENLEAEAESASAMEVSWDEVPGGNMSYRIRRRERGASGWAKTLTGTGTSVTDTGLEAVIEYEYRARTVYRLGGQTYRSDWSDSVFGTTKAPAAPVPRVDGTTATRVDLEWSTVPDAVEYEVRRRSPPDTGSWESLGTILGTSLNDENLTTGVEYEYQVRAFVVDARDRSLTTDWSESVTAEPGS